MIDELTHPRAKRAARRPSAIRFQHTLLASCCARWTTFVVSGTKALTCWTTCHPNGASKGGHSTVRDNDCSARCSVPPPSAVSQRAGGRSRHRHAASLLFQYKAHCMPRVSAAGKSWEFACLTSCVPHATVPGPPGPLAAPPPAPRSPSAPRANDKRANTTTVLRRPPSPSPSYYSR